MDFKSLFDEVKTEILAGEHILINVDSSIKHAYLTGLAIIAATNAKDEFTKVEKQYLDKMAISLNLPDELYKNALTTGKNPDKSVIKTIVETIDQRYMQFLFLIDAYMLAHIDGEISETENHIINSFIQFFKFTNDNCQILKEMKSAIIEKNFNMFVEAVKEIKEFERDLRDSILKYYFFEETIQYLIDRDIKEKELIKERDKLCEHILQIEKEKSELQAKIKGLGPRPDSMFYIMFNEEKRIRAEEYRKCENRIESIKVEESECENLIKNIEEELRNL